MKQPNSKAKIYALIRHLTRLVHSWMTGLGVLLGVGVVVLLVVWGARFQLPESQSDPVNNKAGRGQGNEILATDPETMTWAASSQLVEPDLSSASVDRALSPVDESGAAPLSPAAPVSLLLTAETESGDQGIVYNGETITYVLTFSPTGVVGDIISDVLILNDLSVFQGTFQDVRCTDCIKETGRVTITNPWGGVVVITFTKAVRWSIPLASPITPIQKTFSAQVIGQADGSSFSNVAYAEYKLNGQIKGVTSNVIETTVRVPIYFLGEASVSAAPTWFSNDVGGTLDHSWGDFDGDGDLDLVLGSALGATVYENKGEGVLDEVWTSPQNYDETNRLAFGVSWADLNNDNRLELVVVGDSLDQTAVTSGTNYVYSWYRDQGDIDFQETDVFSSNYQLVRIAIGHFYDDGDTDYVDLVASTNGINPACPVLLYTNTLALKGGNDYFTGPGWCVSSAATASLNSGDFDNDDDGDLAVGLFPDLAMLFKNEMDGTLGLPFGNPLLVADALAFLPYDFSWGDYNSDGYLDLAAAFPFERKSQIYTNQAGDTFDLPLGIRSNSFLTPLSVDWGDLNGDGRLDLAAASSPLKVYLYNATRHQFSEIRSLSPSPQTGQYWSIQAVDYDNDGDLDLSLSDRNGPSLIFTTFAPFLNPTLTEVDRFSASFVAWGNADGRYCNDLLFGAGQGQVNSPLYHVDRHCEYNQPPLDLGSGFGTSNAAFGDLEGDGDLDIAFALPGANRVYRAGETQPNWSSGTDFPSYSIVWGDADDDGDLDLLVGNDGPNELFINRQGVLDTLPTWQTMAQSETLSIAWGDFNRDRYLDFAVGNSNQPNQVYCNNKNNTFSLVWSSRDSVDTRSVAWGDYDQDGDLDLAVGNYGEKNYIYQNLTCETRDCETRLVQNLGCGASAGLLSATPVWSSTDSTSQTVSLAWGDWDNDGDQELAVGNKGERDQVYANLSKPGSPQLVWLWTSGQAHQTTAIAWGDKDQDGDLDLAVSQELETGPNGFYENTYIQPSHLTIDFANTMPLPNNPSYLSIDRPGNTDDAYFFSSAEFLSGYYNPTVSIHYRLFDPDGTRDMGLGDSNLPGDPILDTIYEFSTDKGSTWQPATPASGWSGSALTTTRKGFEATFLWNAVVDQAISDDALFRITIVQQNQQGPFQRPVCSAISPPFRVRGLTCIWPQGPFIEGPDTALIDTPVTFVGGYENVSGSPVFKWDFGDGTSPFYGDTTVEHAFSRSGTFDVSFSITGEACPVSKTVTATHQIVVRGSKSYLPVVTKGASSDQIVNSALTIEPQAHQISSAPEQVRWLQGSPEPEWGRTTLEWQFGSPHEQVLGYRLYRRAHQSQKAFQLIATLPADVNTYVDETAFCGQRYYVTAFTAVGESLPSVTNYISPPCRE